ncbi:hypothetical protein GBA52_007128 [Prunus armeniaca]|nr:hypothetical protein GBA52_007128 [Prunus armeniaca]
MHLAVTEILHSKTSMPVATSAGYEHTQETSNLDDAASAIDDYTPGKLRIIDFSASPDQQGELLPIIMSHYARSNGEVRA